MMLVSSWSVIHYRYKGYDIIYLNDNDFSTLRIDRGSKTLRYYHSDDYYISVPRNSTERIVYLSNLIDKLINVNFTLPILKNK